MDNLLAYLYQHFGNNLAVSGVTGDLLVWGIRAANDIELLALSFNKEATVKLSVHGTKLIETGKWIASQIGVPFLLIDYPSDLDTNPNSILTINGDVIRRGQAPDRIQEYLNTQETRYGTKKAVNRSTNDAFHAWARQTLPSNYIRVDLDALLLSSLVENKPNAIIEVKRSTKVQPERWKPYKDDARNYYIHGALARMAGLKFITLNHSNLNTPVLGSSKIGIHNITAVSLDPENVESNKYLRNADAVVNWLSKISNE